MGNKILIADDEPDMLTVVNFRLKKAGYETIVAVDGKEALEKARQCIPDIMIVDYRMPFMNGLEVCRAVKGDERLKHIPVVLLTASAEAMKMNQYQEAGIVSCIVKPFDPDELQAVIAKFILKT